MNKRKFRSEIKLLLGIEKNTTSHAEKWVSGFGAIIGILTVYWGVSLSMPHQNLQNSIGALMVASIGASAVLVFAVPHGVLSQPWAVFGGHLVSAIVGVSCQKLFPHYFWTGALAVGLAVGAMYYLRCIHPPGGATALGAVIGGAQVHKLGFDYVLMPVLLNVTLMLAAGIAFNALFYWRRYPAHIGRNLRKSMLKNASERQFELTQEDFAAAMLQLDSYVDITAENLTDLLELAKQHAEKNVTHPEEILPGRFYSNGKLGYLWSVRQVLDGSENEIPQKDKVIYKVLAGNGAYQTGICLRDEFRQWARFEVIPGDEGRWLKVTVDQ